MRRTTAGDRQPNGSRLDSGPQKWRQHYAPRRNRTYNLVAARVPPEAANTAACGVAQAVFPRLTPEPPPKRLRKRQVNGSCRGGESCLT